MDIKTITLEGLLANPLIPRINVEGVWFFAKENLNIFYDGNFEFVVSEKINYQKDNFTNQGNFVSWPIISEHVEHRKSGPSFEDRIDQLFTPKE